MTNGGSVVVGEEVDGEAPVSPSTLPAPVTAAWHIWEYWCHLWDLFHCNQSRLVVQSPALATPWPTTFDMVTQIDSTIHKHTHAYTDRQTDAHTHTRPAARSTLSTHTHTLSLSVTHADRHTHIPIIFSQIGRSRHSKHSKVNEVI